MTMRVVSARAQVDGLLAWWTLAGVDSCVDEDRVDWLHPKAAPARPAAAPLAEAPSSRPVGYPDSLSAFHDHLASASGLPEARWPGSRILPKGPQAPRLMIVVSAPDASAQAPGEPLAPDAMRLLAGMTRAIGLDLAQCYIASLSLVPPPGGIIDAATTEALAERMRHHIALVCPEALLLLGDQANRALSPTENGGGDKNLPFVNHRGGIVEAISVIHPRLMLGQPSAKAEAWRSLQRLARGWGQ